MALRIVIYVVLGLGALAIAAALIGSFGWNGASRRLLSRMEAARVSGPTTRSFDAARDLPGLPAPVQAYFRRVLPDGQRMIEAVTVRHRGTFDMGKGEAKWVPFTSKQRVVVRRPGFLWDARVRVAPGVTAFVRDAYVAGRGMLVAKAFGLITAMEQPPSRELSRGELLRWFAECAWYPTALLPSRGVRWTAVDGSSAEATMEDGGLSLTLLFTFGGDGLIRTVRARERGMLVGKEIVQTPWEGRWSRYERRGGMLVPLDGEVAWLLPEGPRPYWRGRIEEIAYEFAE